ncbi:MAG: efflux RND transporter periplasmic adaptor subunit [Gemmataceae bacterium]|nr:efflux RND transporter periplasmic adaptor subunit [Gemmataceae bacterium]
MISAYWKTALARTSFLCLAVGLPALVAGCGEHQAAAPGTQAPAATPAQAPIVTTVRPEQKPLRRVIEQPAHVEAFEETPLFARISGYIQKVHVDIGDRVKGPRSDNQGKQVEPGQVLAELWVPEMEEELRQKEALVLQAQAEVEQAAAALEAADAHVATAQAMVLEAEAGRDRAQANYERWQSESKRVAGLVQGKIIDEQVGDETLNQFKAAAAARKEVEAKVRSAEATAKESEAKRNKAKADLAAAKARVQVAQAEEGRFSALLEYSKVRAPYDGVITSRTIHTGHYLNGTGTKPLFVIARIDIVRIMVDVPEADAMYISDGVPARIRCQMIKDQEFDGKVTRSSWSLDAKARTLRTQIDLPNAQGRLRPGMYAYVTFNAELPSRFTLPASAVITQGGEACCYRVESGKAVRTPVKVGVRDGQLVQVLKKRNGSANSGKPAVWEDFTGKEEVALTSAGSLSDGQPVIVAEKR